MKRPFLQALVLADQVYTDKNTNKRIIAGTFNTLHAMEFPSMFGRMTFAYMSLTNLQGEYDFVLRFIDLKENEILLESSPLHCSCNEPLATHELVLPVPTFPMPREGVYMFELYANNEAIGYLRMLVRGPESKHEQ